MIFLKQVVLPNDLFFHKKVVKIGNMTVEIRNTNDCSHRSSVLVDLGKYLDVNEWMIDVVSRKSAFKPDLCGVKFGNEWHYLLSAGHVAPDADDIICKIRRLPISIRKIPNNNMKVTVDVYDSTLYIELGI